MPRDSDDEPEPPVGTYQFPTEVEDHNPAHGKCRYKKPSQHERIRVNACLADMEYDKVTLTRQCQCGKYSNDTNEVHYSLNCKWRRFQDQRSNRVYLIRRCVCKKPSSY